MLTSQDLVTMAQGAAQQGVNYLIQAIGIGQKGAQPTSEECHAFVHALCMTIAQMELYLALHLPAEEQPHVRKMIAQLSDGMATRVREIQEKLLTPKLDGAIIQDSSVDNK